MLLSVSQVSKAFGIDIVLEDVSFRIESREKVALVGRNGTGKTTLLKLLVREDEPDKGSVQWARGAKVGKLRQEHPVDLTRTVIEEAQAGVASLFEMKERLEDLELRIEDDPTDDDLEEYARLHEHFSEKEGYSLERNVRVVLQKMGFEEEDYPRSTASLSGGEKTRLAIARLLLEEPDLLILDEPTNHLDLQATEWLESWIRNYHGAILLVSHDQRFLEATVGRVLELRNHGVKNYPGDFRTFKKLRAEEDARLAEMAERQSAQIAKLDEFVRRFMNSQRTAQARGRLKMMNRLIDGKIEAPSGDKGMKGGFKQAERSGDPVITTEKLSSGYPDNLLIKDFDWTVRFGERWGVIGENGAGKSTLIKTILGKLPSLGGRSRLGSKVVPGYFSQDTAEVDPDSSPLQFIMEECDLEGPAARDLLGKFLFSGDDVFRPVHTLSGGEKNKLVLALLTYLSPNLLILDEPTNHLDMDSREALAGVLQEYSGTLVLISHDRWLLGQVTDRILDVRKAGPVLFPGSYDEYRARQKANTLEPTAPTKGVEVKPTAPAWNPRELSKEIGRMEKAIVALEGEVAKAEEELASLQAKLGDPTGHDVVALSHSYLAQEKKVAELLSEWEKESTKLEELRGLQGVKA